MNEVNVDVVLHVSDRLGVDGKSAFETALEGGYTGTSAQFTQALASIGTGSNVEHISRLDCEIKKIIGNSGTGTEIFSGATVHVGYIDENGQIVIP